MELSKILAISGKPGLFKNVGQSKSGVIVESLLDGKRFPAFAHEKISSLAEISVFTTDDDVSLEEVFKSINEKYEGVKAIDPKSSGTELKAFLSEILPDWDQERVYTSDIKKMIGWYNLLVENDLLEFTEEEEEEPKVEEASDDAEGNSKPESESSSETETA